MHRTYEHTPQGPARVPHTPLRCPHYGSSEIIKYGNVGGVQRLFCKKCERKWADNDALPYMQTPTDQVGAAVSMFYEGQSLNSIRRLLQQVYNAYPSDSSVYRWVARFSERAIDEAKNHKPDVGNTWVADETVLKLDNEGNVWFWDIIDAKTRFLLASHISRTRTTKGAQKLMELAAKRAGKTPKVVVTDKLNVYLDGIELTFGADTKHVATKPFTVEQSTNLIERFHGTLKDRTKVMRGLKDMQTARLFTDGWLVYYNYLRPHEALNDRTPAQAAGVRYPYRNWHDIVASGQVSTVSQSSVVSAPRVPVISVTRVRSKPVARTRRPKPRGKSRARQTGRTQSLTILSR